MNHKKVFIRLLKDFGCYKPYMKNFKEKKRYIDKFNDEYDKSFGHFIELSLELRKNQLVEDTFFYFLNDAFDWGQTDEKFDYWSNIAHRLQHVGKCLYDIPTFDKLYDIPTFDKDGIYSDEEIKTLQKILYEEK